MSDVTKEKVIELVAEPLKSEGYEIADLIVATHGSRFTIRLFLYGEKGVSVKECARLSRLVGEILEPTDLFDDGYNLEISSPGLERPLRNQMDFRYRIGERVKIAFRDESRKGIEAKIVEVTENRVSLSGVDGETSLDIAEIDNARILF